MAKRVKIGHASIDENGNISGGQVGDQTGKEICVRDWYNKPWNVCLVCTDPVIADKAATFVEQVCADPNYGYDQYERLSGYNNIKKNKGKVKGAKGEFDCSSLTAGAYIHAGLKLSPSLTTRNLRQALLDTGKFVAYTDDAHLKSDKYAKRGAVYLSEGHHVVVALEDGEGDVKVVKGKNPYTQPTSTLYYDVENKQVVCTGYGVKWLQFELGISTDGSFGPATDKAVRKFQEEHGLEVDGRVGKNTRAALVAEA